MYKWRDGARVSVDASVAGRELERIRNDNNGKLRAKDIVHQSKPKAAPLHNEFEWNNTKAANLYREEQARYVVRSLKTVYDDKTSDGKPIETRAYVKVQHSDESSSYTPMINALSDEETRHQVIYKAYKNLISTRREIAEIGELSAALDLIDQSIEMVRVVLKREESKTIEKRI